MKNIFFPALIAGLLLVNNYSSHKKDANTDQLKQQTHVKINLDSTGTVTDIDGNVYKTVKIGSQWWMAENLKVTHYRNGEPIPNVTDSTDWYHHNTSAYCAYHNDENNADTYGYLYNWYAIYDIRNIAPPGWHVPTDEEWKTLELSLGMNRTNTDDRHKRGTDEGGKLKEAGTDHWNSPNTGATNECKFTALPGGFREHNGSFSNIGMNGLFWSCTWHMGRALYRYLSFNSSDIGRFGEYPRVGFSVRLVRDSEKNTGTLKDIDGNIYKTVKIGNQWWMAENLKVTRYRNGDDIPNVTDDTEWGNLLSGAYCVYHNDENNRDTYGYLYNWYAVNDARNIAPPGWHIPNDEDWKVLDMALGISYLVFYDDKQSGTDEGGKLKEAGTDHWEGPNLKATNESGFSGLPAGVRYFDVPGFSGIKLITCFWTSEQSTPIRAMFRYLEYYRTDMVRGEIPKCAGLSIRLVKD